MERLNKKMSGTWWHQRKWDFFIIAEMAVEMQTTTRRWMMPQM